MSNFLEFYLQQGENAKNETEKPVVKEKPKETVKVEQKPEVPQKIKKIFIPLEGEEFKSINKSEIKQEKQIQQKQEKVKQVKNPVKSSNLDKVLEGDNPKPLQGEELRELFIRSETPAFLEQEWIKIYNNSFITKKKGYVVERCKQGLFRLDENKNLEILSKVPTYGKTTKDLLSELTRPGYQIFNNKIQ